MTRQLTPISLFLSSPRDVQEERAIVRKVVGYVDEVFARPLGFALNLISSETLLPDGGPPQEVIDRQVPEYDVYIGVMWSRFGTPTSGAGSGTEDEFLQALERHRTQLRLPRILFYFCDRPVPFPRSDEDAEQLVDVFRFRRRAAGAALVSFYSETSNFEELLRRHLVDFIMSRLEAPRPPLMTAEKPASLERLEALLKECHWIGYSPVDFDPDVGHHPDAVSLDQDLAALAASPFRALLTFGSEGVLADIPSLARRHGMKGVIMGVYDPLNSSQIDAAIRASQHVDGYCIGHLGIRAGRYSAELLVDKLTMVRNSTGKPVTTCETIEDLLFLPDVAQRVDWLCPDVHPFWHEGSAPEAALSDVVNQVESVRKLRDIVGAGKFVLLNMVSYPTSGGPGLTEGAQAEFFRRILQRFKSDTHIPSRICPCYFAAFDNDWKRPERGWSAAELHTGLYRIDRTPKSAVTAFMESLRRP